MRTPGVTTLRGGSPFDALAARSAGMNNAYGLGAYAPRTPVAPMPGATPASQVDRPTGYGAGGYGAPPAAPAAGGGGGGIAGYGGASPDARSGSSESYPNQKTAAAGDNSQSVYNLDTDPIVQKIKALNAQNYGTAVAGAQSNAKGDLIDSGFNLADIIRAHPELASSPIADVLGDPATALAAQHNPYSVAANLALAHQRAVQGIDQNTNDQNLFYSSTHGNMLGDEAHGYLGNVSGAQDTLAQALAALIGGLKDESASEQQKLADAYSTARTNAVNNAINSGETFVGYDANGNPIFKTPGSNSGTDTTAVNNDPGGSAAGNGVPAGPGPPDGRTGGTSTTAPVNYGTGPYIGTMPPPVPAAAGAASAPPQSPYGTATGPYIGTMPATTPIAAAVRKAAKASPVITNKRG